jgi:hypothetical protein
MALILLKFFPLNKEKVEEIKAQRKEMLNKTENDR